MNLTGRVKKMQILPLASGLVNTIAVGRRTGYQEDETIQHLRTQCVFSRQFWYLLLGCLGLSVPPPEADSEDFFEWWQKVSDMVGKEAKGRLNSLIILGAWTIWRVRTNIVFNGVSPSVSQAINHAQDEAELWLLAGAKVLTLLVAFSPAGQ